MAAAQAPQAAAPTTVPPRLQRAVAEATQPYGPFLQGAALYTLEEYLADTSSSPAVYQALLDRASAEPISLAVVAKCVDVLKRYIARFPASEDILQQIERFCQATATNLGNTNSGLQKSVLYLHTLALNLLEGGQAAPGTARTQAHVRGISEPALLVKRGSSSSLGRAELHRTNSVPEQAPAAPRPPSSLQPQLSAAETSASYEPQAEAGPGGLQADVLHWRWGPTGEDEAAASQPTPEQREQLSHFCLTLPPEPGGGVWPSEAHCRAAERDVRIIRRVQRQQAQQASRRGPESLRPKLRDNRPRLLFQHLPYSQQETLRLADQEVAAVVEAVLGVGDQQRFWGEGDLLEARDRGGHAGRVCASVLVKLLLDLWALNPAAVSLPLAFMLLHGGLESERPSLRARAFDVVYNLAVHAELLHPPQAAPPDLELQARDDTAAGEGLKDAAAQEADRQRLRRWLLLLLFQLLDTVLQRREVSEAVWAAALGALLHLSAAHGRPSLEALQGMPPRLLAALLDCCLRFRWSEHVHCHLIRLAANLLYVPAAAAVGEGPGGAAPPVLSAARLADFGGPAAVVRHFRAAPSPEAARNLLAVLLDHVAAAHIKAGVAAGAEPGAPGLLDGLRLAGQALECGAAAEALQGAFQCAWPGFSAEFARALGPQAAAQNGDAALNGSLAHGLAGSMLQRLEALACESAASAPPPELLPAVQATLDCVAGDSGSSGGGGGGREAAEAWDRLAALFCSAEPGQAALGASWLLSLLVAAAERHLTAGAHRSASLRRGAVALFPQLPGVPPGPTAPRGIHGQDRLAALLQRVLSQAAPQAQAGMRFVGVLRRLLHYIRCKCSGAAAAPPSPGDGQGLLKSLGSFSISSPPAAPGFLLSDDEAAAAEPGEALAADSPARDGGEWEEDGAPWAAADAMDLMLPTLSLAVEWLLDTPLPARGEACTEAAALLLELVVCRPAAPQRPGAAAGEAAQPPEAEVGDWLLEEYLRAGVQREAAPPGLLAAAHACSTVAALLLGAAAVPREALLKASPVLLARLLQQLGGGGGGGGPRPGGEGAGAAARAADVRAGLLLLLVGRCSLETAALQQAGGEGVFVDLLADGDPRVRFHAAVFLQQRLRVARPEVYRRALRHLMGQAQAHGDDQLLRNAHLQLSAMLELRLVDFSV